MIRSVIASQVFVTDSSVLGCKQSSQSDGPIHSILYLPRAEHMNLGGQLPEPHLCSPSPVPSPLRGGALGLLVLREGHTTGDLPFLG